MVVIEAMTEESCSACEKCDGDGSRERGHIQCAGRHHALIASLRAERDELRELVQDLLEVRDYVEEGYAEFQGVYKRAESALQRGGSKP